MVLREGVDWRGGGAHGCRMVERSVRARGVDAKSAASWAHSRVEAQRAGRAVVRTRQRCDERLSASIQPLAEAEDA